MKKGTTDVSYISEKLADNGYKITKQRCEIIKAIYENNVHMNADEIYKKVKHKKIGLSTVYRNLMILETVGAIKRINTANTSYYELQTLGEIDIHAKCIKCNKIVDIKKRS
ncbi:Fur family transcriptional regulator [Clostridium carboxidivorans]|uniref:Fur family transcriptional regulator n=1 Tax=Clostridium carboxidivorans TaxID=217159 RepID=UPI000300EECC|nr:transcriptional repressor [Clostridium carboxidivorans]